MTIGISNDIPFILADPLRPNAQALQFSFSIPRAYVSDSLAASSANSTAFCSRIPARKAFTIERQPQSVGWFVAPRINLDLRDIAGHAGWDVGMFIAPLFSDRQYHNYFYSVAPSFATPSRPAYQASGGYAGTELLVATSRRYRDFWVGANHCQMTSMPVDPSPCVAYQGCDADSPVTWCEFAGGHTVPPFAAAAIISSASASVRVCPSTRRRITDGCARSRPTEGAHNRRHG